MVKLIYDGCSICKLVEFLSKNKNTDVIIAGEPDELGKEIIQLYSEKYNIAVDYQNKPVIEVIKENKNKMVVENHKYKTAVVCVYKSGSPDYDKKWPEYVKNLYKCVRQNVRQAPFDFFYMSDKELPMGDIKYIKLESNLQGWHAKFEIYRDELWKDYRAVLYLDLDTIVTGYIDTLLLENRDFLLLRDFHSPTRMATGVVFFKPGDKRWIYDAVVKKNPTRDQWDQHILENLIKDKIQIDFLQDYYNIASYKDDILKGKNPKDYHIVAFHGHPRPHEINWDLGIKNKNNKLEVKQMKFSPVPQMFKDERVYIIGGGPSLRGINLDEYLMGKQVFAVNDGYLFDCAGYVFFGDDIWWKHHEDHITKGNYLEKQRWFSTSSLNLPKVTRLKYTSCGFSKDRSQVSWNSNSGFCTMNIAALAGASELILLGFDMHKDKNGDSNWHQNIRTVLNNTYTCFLSREQKMNEEMFRHFPDLKVIVAGLDSSLTKWEKRDLMEVLNDAKGN